MLTGQRALIVEDEFLIAFEIQRILENANVASSVTARTVEEAMSLAHDWRNFHLAVVEFPFQSADARALARGLANAGVKLIISSTDSHHAEIPGLEQWPVVKKPFSEDELLAAYQRVIGGVS